MDESNPTRKPDVQVVTHSTPTSTSAPKFTGDGFEHALYLINLGVIGARPQCYHVERFTSVVQWIRRA